MLKKVFHPVLVLALPVQAAPFAGAQETAAPRKVREQIRGVRAEGGYLHWLRKLDDFGGDFNRAEMVKAFITSIEYKERFGP